MKIVSWNINSLRLRMPLLQELVNEQNPDIICLQETKVEDSSFPLWDLKKLGFDFVEFAGEKSYNGVAILAKTKLHNVETIDVLDSGHKRHIAVRLENGVILHNFYVPAGGDIPDPELNPKFGFKLKFVDWMNDYFAQNYNQNEPLIMLGDINIAPLEHDVWSHKELLSVVSHTPIEVAKMEKLRTTLNWVDCHRLFTPEHQKLYSWWSYRALDPIKSDRGRRLDHIWVTPVLKSSVAAAKILKDFRTKTRPSDHVPIAVELNF